MTKPCGALPPTRKENCPPAAQATESNRNWGRFMFRVQLRVWLSRLVGSLRTSGVLSLTVTLTRLLPLPSDCGKSVKVRLVSPASAVPLADHWILSAWVGGCRTARLKFSDCGDEAGRFVLAGVKASVGFIFCW